MDESAVQNRPECAAAWNVVVTVHEAEYHAACEILRAFGTVMPTDYQNVLVMQVVDPGAFLDELCRRIAAEPGIANSLSRAIAFTETFVFRDPAEFEAQARERLHRVAPALAGKSFHVRMHRRGLKGSLSSRDQEQRLGRWLLGLLQQAGTPGRPCFDDPDAILAVETLDHRAGLSLWTRDELRRFPVLKLD